MAPYAADAAFLPMTRFFAATLLYAMPPLYAFFATMSSRRCLFDSALHEIRYFTCAAAAAAAAPVPCR